MLEIDKIHHQVYIMNNEYAYYIMNVQKYHLGLAKKTKNIFDYTNK